MKNLLRSWKLMLLMTVLSTTAWANHGNVTTPAMSFFGVYRSGAYVSNPNTITVRENDYLVFNFTNQEESGICVGDKKDLMYIEFIVTETAMVQGEIGHQDFSNHKNLPTTLYHTEVKVVNPGDVKRIEVKLPCLLTSKVYCYWRLRKYAACHLRVNRTRYSPWGSLQKDATPTKFYAGLNRLPQVKCKNENWDVIYPRVQKLGYNSGSFSQISATPQIVPSEVQVNWYLAQQNGTRGTLVYTTFGDVGFSPDLVSSSILTDEQKEAGGTFYYEPVFSCTDRISKYLNEQLGYSDPDDVLNQAAELYKGSVTFVRLPDLQGFIEDNGLSSLTVTRPVYNIDQYSDVLCKDEFRCKLKDFTYVHLNNLYYSKPLSELLSAFPELTSIDRFDVEFDWLQNQGGTFVEMGEQYMSPDSQAGPHQRKVCYEHVADTPQGKYYRVKYNVSFKYRLDINDQDEAGGPYQDELTIDCSFHIDYLIYPSDPPATVFGYSEEAYASYQSAVKYEQRLSQYIQNVLGQNPNDELCDLIGTIILPLDGTLGGIVPGRDGGNGGTVDPNPTEFIEFIDQCTSTGVVRLPAENLPLNTPLNDPILNDLMNSGQLNFKWVDQAGNILSTDLIFDYLNPPSTVPNILSLDVSIDNSPYVRVHQTAVYNSCLPEDSIGVNLDTLNLGMILTGNQSPNLNNVHQYFFKEHSENRSINETKKIEYNNFKKAVSKLIGERLEDVVAYPNPIRNFESIQLSNCPENCSILLTNLQGQTMDINYVQNGDQIVINFNQQIAEGMYFVNITSYNETKGIAIQVIK